MYCCRKLQCYIWYTQNCARCKLNSLCICIVLYFISNLRKYYICTNNNYCIAWGLCAVLRIFYSPLSTIQSCFVYFQSWLCLSHCVCNFSRYTLIKSCCVYFSYMKTKYIVMRYANLTTLKIKQSIGRYK